MLPIRRREFRAVACGQVVLEGICGICSRPFLTGSCESESESVGRKMRTSPSGVLFNEHYHASRGEGRVQCSSIAWWSA